MVTISPPRLRGSSAWPRENQKLFVQLCCSLYYCTTSSLYYCVIVVYKWLVVCTIISLYWCILQFVLLFCLERAQIGGCTQSDASDNSRVRPELILTSKGWISPLAKGSPRVSRQRGFLPRASAAREVGSWEPPRARCLHSLKTRPAMISNAQRGNGIGEQGS